MLDNPFFERPELYREMKWAVKDYNNLVERHEELLELSSLSVSKRPDGLPRGTKISTPTENIALLRSEKIDFLEHKLNAIDKARESINPLYREAVWITATEDFQQGDITYAFPISRSTLCRELRKFYWRVAENLGLVDEDW